MRKRWSTWLGLRENSNVVKLTIMKAVVLATSEPTKSTKKRSNAAVVRTRIGCNSGPRDPSVKASRSSPRFPSGPSIIRVPLFLRFEFNKGTQKEKRAKGH